MVGKGSPGATGSVQKDSVKPAEGGEGFRKQVHLQGFHSRGVEAADVFFQLGEASFIPIHSEDFGFAASQFRDLCGFTTDTGAGIQDSIARLWVQ